MVIRGGENVDCAEVEAALVEHPKVAAACVFGIPDEALGEQVAAVVVVSPDARVSEQELRDVAATRLAAFKVPGRIWLDRARVQISPSWVTIQALEAEASVTIPSGS